MIFKTLNKFWKGKGQTKPVIYPTHKKTSLRIDWGTIYFIDRDEMDDDASNSPKVKIISAKLNPFYARPHYHSFSS